MRFLFPSSIAVYGLPDAEAKRKAGPVAEDAWTLPITMYGCNKLYGEHLGRYYSRHYRQLAAEEEARGVDFRAIRFPGLISAFTMPSGGTSDYAPEMLHAAAQGRPYACFVREDTRIPFMAMPDAIDAMLALADAPAEGLASPVYNVTAFNPSAGELAELVRSAFPGAAITFAPDRRRQGSSTRGRRTWTTPGRDGTGGSAPGTTSSVRCANTSCRTSGGATGEHDMDGATRQRIQAELDEIEAAGLTKHERVIESPQGATITVEGRTLLNFCANNYLGLADDPDVVRAAREGLERWGLGLSSVRFICGTQDIHKELEAAIARFLGTEDTILYTSCFDANGGLFETLLDERDAVISDALNHASIIDGIRLSKAERHRYAHGDMEDLARLLRDTAGARTRLIATDGVFSMDGDVAPLREICDLADRYHALVMVDDSHATGFFGATGRGTPEHWGVEQPGRHPHLDPRQGPRRRQRGLHDGPARDRRVAATAVAAVPLLEHARAGDRVRVSHLPGSCSLGPPSAATDCCEHALVPGGDDAGGLPDPPRGPSDRPDHAGRRAPRRCHGVRPAERGHLRRRLLVPRRAERPGPHPCPDQRGAFAGAPRARRRRVHQGGPRPWGSLRRVGAPCPTWGDHRTPGGRQLGSPSDC